EVVLFRQELPQAQKGLQKRTNLVEHSCGQTGLHDFLPAKGFPSAQIRAIAHSSVDAHSTFEISFRALARGRSVVGTFDSQKLGGFYPFQLLFDSAIRSDHKYHFFGKSLANLKTETEFELQTTKEARYEWTKTWTLRRTFVVWLRNITLFMKCCHTTSC